MSDSDARGGGYHDALDQHRAEADMARWSESGRFWDALPTERKIELHRESAAIFGDADQARMADELEAQMAAEAEMDVYYDTVNDRHGDCAEL